MSMKNKVFLTFEQFEEAWRAESIPMPDVQHSYTRIMRPAGGKKNIRPWLRPIPVSIGILCLSFLLFAGTNVSAIFLKYILHDDKGEAVFEYVQSSPEQLEIDKEIREMVTVYKNDMEAVEEGLSSGEATLFFITEAYRLDGYYFPLQKNEEFKELESLVQATDTSFRLPDALPQNYSFLSGEIIYETQRIDPSWLDQLYEEASSANLPYLVEPLKLTKKAQSIILNYSDESHPGIPFLSLLISQSTGSTSTSDIRSDATEIVQVEGMEAIYEQPFHKLTFVLEHNGVKLDYSVSGSQSSTKEDLLLLAKSLLSESH